MDKAVSELKDLWSSLKTRLKGEGTCQVSGPVRIQEQKRTGSCTECTRHSIHIYPAPYPVQSAHRTHTRTHIRARAHGIGYRGAKKILPVIKCTATHSHAHTHTHTHTHTMWATRCEALVDDNLKSASRAKSLRSADRIHTSTQPTHPTKCTKK